MKKIVLMILALAGLAMNAFAAAATNTPTYTPNATQTQAIVNIQATQTAVAATATYVKTAFPTLTPTLTPTGTLTPSLSPTPGPKQLKSAFRTRIYFPPTDLTQADGITSLGASALPGATSSWLAQSLSQTVAVLSTGAAEVRLATTIPWNYKGDLRLFAIMGVQTAGDSVTITANMVGQSFNQTTVTAGTASYLNPAGGLWYLNGTAANVIAGVQPLAPLWSSTFVISRVWMPLNPLSLNYWQANPGGTIQRGDIVNFDIKRTTAGLGNVYIYGFELQYDYAQDAQP